MFRVIFVPFILLCCSCTLMPVEVPMAPDNDAPAVVFDIDGTLTPTVMKIWDARNDAARSVKAYFDKGYKIIYLSARVSFFQSAIPDWLTEHGFPAGTLHVPEVDEDYDDHAKFKSRILKKYQANHWKVDFAYGDSSTDFKAYASVGIPESHVFALRREGEEACQSGKWKTCLNGWTEHIDTIADSINVKVVSGNKIAQ